jgi:hypothetical protein
MAESGPGLPPEVRAELHRLRNQELTLTFVEYRIRKAAPAACCTHEDPPCLSCGLTWLIESAQPPASPVEP